MDQEVRRSSRLGPRRITGVPLLHSASARDIKEYRCRNSITEEFSAVNPLESTKVGQKFLHEGQCRNLQNNVYVTLENWFRLGAQSLHPLVSKSFCICTHIYRVQMQKLRGTPWNCRFSYPDLDKPIYPVVEIETRLCMVDSVRTLQPTEEENEMATDYYVLPVTGVDHYKPAQLPPPVVVNWLAVDEEQNRAFVEVIYNTPAQRAVFENHYGNAANRRPNGKLTGNVNKWRVLVGARQEGDNEAADEKHITRKARTKLEADESLSSYNGPKRVPRINKEVPTIYANQSGVSIRRR